MKEKEWGLGLVEKAGTLVSNAFFCKIAPGARRRALEEYEGMGGLGKMRLSYHGTEVEVVRKYLFSSCRKSCRKGPSYLGIRPIGEPLQSIIPLSRKVIREIQLRIPKEKE